MSDLKQAAQQALEQQAEPVGEVIDERGEVDYISYVPPVGTKLYTTPPQRKPLTDEMRKQMKEASDSFEMRGAFANGWLSAEAAHNIQEPKS